MIGDTTLDQHQREQLQTALVLPKELHIALEANPHLAVPLRDSLRKAVEVSFAHQETRMRVITGSEITRRAELALQILTVGHVEQGFSILQMRDALPGLLVDVIKRDNQGNVLLEKEHQQGRWTTGDGDPETEALAEMDGVLDQRQFTGDPEDEDGVLEDDEDLTEGIDPEPFSDEEFEEIRET